MKKATRMISLLLSAMLACSSIFASCGKITHIHTEDDPEGFIAVANPTNRYDHRFTETAYINDQIDLRFELPGSNWSFTPDDEVTVLLDDAAADAEEFGTVDMEAASATGSNIRIMIQDAALLERLDSTMTHSTYPNALFDMLIEDFPSDDSISMEPLNRCVWEMAGKSWNRQDVRFNFYETMSMDLCMMIHDTGSLYVAIAVTLMPGEAQTLEELLGCFSSAADPAPVNPAPVDPAPVAPAPVDPAPVDPAPVDPAPVVVEPKPEVTDDSLISDLSWKDHRTAGTAYVNDRFGLRFDLPGSKWAFYPDEDLRDLWETQLIEFDSAFAPAAEQLTMVEMQASSETGSSVTVLVLDAAQVERMDRTWNRSDYFDLVTDTLASAYEGTQTRTTVKMTDKCEWEMAGLKWTRQDVICSVQGYTLQTATALSCDTGSTILTLAVVLTSHEGLTMNQLLGSFSSSRSAEAVEEPGSGVSAPAQEDVTGKYVLKEYNGQSFEDLCRADMGDEEAAEYLSMLGISSFGELFTFELEANGSVIFTENGECAGTGTWTQQAGRVIITINGISQEAVLSGGELTLASDDGIVLVFLKK
ncbi:MAG: hypothetical protein IKQ92_06460 [Clostridia bacterium]|nr:hypothetical protein [Clostridia bacterium]